MGTLTYAFDVSLREPGILLPKTILIGRTWMTKNSNDTSPTSKTTTEPPEELFWLLVLFLLLVYALII